MPFISGGMTKRLHQMRHIPWLLGWLGAAGAEGDGRIKIFAMPNNVFKHQKRNEMWRNDPTCAYILHFETWNPFVTLMWHCGGGWVVAGPGPCQTQNAHTSFQHGNLSEVRDQCPAQWQGEGLLVCGLPSVWGEKWTPLSWLTTTAAFRRLQWVKLWSRDGKSCGRSVFHLLNKVLMSNTFFYPLQLCLYLIIFLCDCSFPPYKKPFLPFHQPPWKALHSVQRILIQPISNCDT